MIKKAMESISCLLKAILNKNKYLIFDQLSGFLKGMVLPALLLTTGFLQAQQIEKKPPNILVIVLDDARYDMFQPNGGPAFFNTPGINSIAKEGANFQFTGATTSLCCPSRASIYKSYRGKEYPHPDKVFYVPEGENRDHVERGGLQKAARE